MDSNITFSKYSIDEKYKNLYTSNEILDNNIEDVNKIIFRIPKDIKKIVSIPIWIEILPEAIGPLKYF